MTLLVLHLAGAAGMTGIGWFVQAVHYPLFGYAAGPRWPEFHAEHSRRTARVVGLPWALQGVTALALLAVRPVGVPLGLIVAAVLLAGTTVLATVAFALPAHGRLATAHSDAVERRLLRTGWLRTWAWTAATVVAVVMLLVAGPGA
ncbi:MAG: DUF1772 domain-containing protein [Actinobacteria bacterium]|nr:DUF1772 domain-containing protein [Actinomycetota bacterium]